MSNKVLISVVGVILAITILVIGIVIGKRFSNEANVSSDILQKESFQAGWDAAKAKYNQVYSKIFIPANSTEDVVVGVIHGIDGNKLKVAIRSNDLLNDATPSEFKTITVADNTKISVGVPQDQGEIKNKIEEGSLDLTKLAIMAEYKEASLADLKTNQFVIVAAPAGSENQSEFTAIGIRAEFVASDVTPAKADLNSQE